MPRLGPQTSVRDSSGQIPFFLILRCLGMCLTATTQGSRLVISVLERDIKVQHVPERAVSWLVATGP